MKTNRARRSVTLVELLVVVVLMGLTIATVTLNLNGGDASRKLAACASQLGSMYRAARLHAERLGLPCRLELSELQGAIVVPTYMDGEWKTTRRLPMTWPHAVRIASVKTTGLPSTSRGRERHWHITVPPGGSATIWEVFATATSGQIVRVRIHGRSGKESLMFVKNPENEGILP